MVTISDTQKRRAVLGGLSKVMFSVLIAGMVWVGFSFVGSTGNTRKPVESKFVDLAPLTDGGSKLFEWEGRPVIVLKRSPEMIRILDQTDALRLQDAFSEESKQPDWARSNYRSRTPQWFVAIAIGSDFGCPLEFLPGSDEQFAGQPWRGGFKDTCRGSRYDLAGRVYAGQNAETNLEIPRYSIEQNILHLGGG